jgi:hypothetical protein
MKSRHTAIDWYFARQQAANKYRQDRQEHPEQSSVDWCVDSLEL